MSSRAEFSEIPLTSVISAEHPDLTRIDQLIDQLKNELDTMQRNNSSSQGIQVAALNLYYIIQSGREQLKQSLDARDYRLF